VHIKEAAQRALNQGFVHYTASAGIPELRESICRQVLKETGAAYRPEQVLVTAGATEAIFIALQAILNPGDEVLAPEPMFVYYTGDAALSGAECISIPLTAEDHFKLRADQVAKHISPRTRALILTSPNNPTGQVYDREDLVEIANLAKQNDFYIISDDIYSRLLYDEADYFNVVQVPGLEERTILINSFSKCYAMDGWRVGYLLASEPVIACALKIHQHLMSCPNTFVQWGAVAALNESQDCVEAMRTEFDRRRSLLIAALDSFGIAFERPRGAFYVFPSVKRYGMTSESFCEYIFDQARVAIVPGNAFGKAGEGYVRLSYATAYEEIEKGMNRFGEALKKI
jgi:aspartate/methionine/tyrosine aminotransferase